jgi:small subunit ribosomal protein S6
LPKQPVLYEAMYILDARIEDAERQEAADTLEAHVRAQGGEVVATRDFGRRRLAYEIEGHLEGVYKVLYFSGLGACVDEVKHEMHLLPEVVRGMIVVANPKYLFDPQAEKKAEVAPAEAEPVTAEAALAEAADEAAAEAAPAEAPAGEAEVVAEDAAAPAAPEAVAEAETAPAEEPAPADEPASAEQAPPPAEPAEVADEAPAAEEG